MADNINNKKSAEKSNDVSLKIASDFYTTPYLQPQVDNQHQQNSNVLYTCTANKFVPIC